MSVTAIWAFDRTLVSVLRASTRGGVSGRTLGWSNVTHIHVDDGEVNIQSKQIVVINDLFWREGDKVFELKEKNVSTVNMLQKM